MGVKVREKPLGSGIYWIFINHHGKRKSKKIGMDEKLAHEVAEKIKAKQSDRAETVLKIVAKDVDKIQSDQQMKPAVVEQATRYKGPCPYQEIRGRRDEDIVGKKYLSTWEKRRE